MTDKMLEGKKQYETFMKKEKSKGKSHAEALTLWKEKKSSTKKSTSVKVVTKQKPRRKKRISGFSRPKKLWDKLNVSTGRQSVNLNSIKRIY